MRKSVIKNISKILDEKKAQNIKIFNVAKLTSLCDYIIIASSSNSNHVRSLTHEVIKILKENNIFSFNLEKDDGYTWVVLDCGYFVINIFHNLTREFYNLEGIWADANELIF